MSVSEIFHQKKVVLISICASIALIIFLSVILQTQQLNEIELVQKYLNTTYTVTQSESSDLLKKITSGSLTEKDTFKSITKKYTRLMTKSGLQDAIDSRQIWSNETTMAMNQCELMLDEFDIQKSEFYSTEKPCYYFSVQVTTKKFDGSEQYHFNPTGIIYLEKTFNGWKINQIINNDKTSITFQLQTTKRVS